MTAMGDSRPFGIIYRVTNKVNGKRYIGQTTMQLSKRWHAHKRADGRCVSLSAAIKKYGAECFEVVEIDRAYSRQELDAKEIAYIEAERTQDPEVGYNLRPGGMTPSFSAETRAIMSARKVGTVLTKEHRAKIAASSAGVPKSAEHCAKVSAAKRGVPKSAAHRAAQSKPRPDFVMSEAHKAAIRRAATGAVFSDERRAKISAALTGIVRGPLTAEEKEKLSAARRGIPRSEADKQKIRDGIAAAKLRKQQAATAAT
jgi:group I intron endonuclease